ncbi:hypothetical protein ACFC18_54250, partial [Streptomyces sp. NPDC056121]
MREDPRAPEPAGPVTEPASGPAAPVDQGQRVRLDRLDRLGWREFGERYWDRRPVLFTSVTPAPFDAHEVFETAVAAAHRGGLFGVPPYAGFAVGGEPQADSGDFLPQPRDGSFEGYHQRLVRQLSGEPYSLSVQAFHAFH